MVALIEKPAVRKTAIGDGIRREKQCCIIGIKHYVNHPQRITNERKIYWWNQTISVIPHCLYMTKLAVFDPNIPSFRLAEPLTIPNANGFVGFPRILVIDPVAAHVGDKAWWPVCKALNETRFMTSKWSSAYHRHP